GREEGHIEEEEEDELYRDVNINQGRGLQTTLDAKDSHVTLTPVHPDGMESIFETTSLLDRMNEAVKVAIQIQSDRLCDEAQRDNDEFLNTVDENMQKIIKEQVKEQVKMELKKILIKKTEGNKSIQRFDEQRNLYKALVEAYESDKIILDTYRETITLKRRRDDDADKDEEPSAGPDQGIQPWISELTKQADTRTYFNKPIDTPLDFSNFLINRLKVDTLTLELLVGPTYELIKGLCKSLVELEYHLEEVFKATTDQLDWVNPKGQQYPHNLLKPLPLIPNNQGRRVIPFEHFINNDLEYLHGGASTRKYTTSITKTKASDYRHIKWIEDLVPRTMWIEEPIAMTSMPSEESPIGGVNVSSSMILLLTESLFAMCIPSEESSL
nr:hypothetical protein [Tanacetum cinerariifolium]